MYRPTVIATEGGVFVDVEEVDEDVGFSPSVLCEWLEEDGGCRRKRSPRITASAWMTVFPPRMMCCVPWMRLRREILLPVSCSSIS